MTIDEPLDEELRAGARRVGHPGRVATLVVAAAAVIGTVVLATRTSGPGRLRPVPSTSVSPTTVAVPMLPAPLLAAVRERYPRAALAETGVEITAAPDPARSYQFQVTQRRVTVSVGRLDGRPDVTSRSANALLVVRRVAGKRVAVSVRVFRGGLTAHDVTATTGLAADARLLAAP